MGNAVLQPNGKILMLNGARVGQTGATAIGKPRQRGAATDCFVYDPAEVDGNRWKVLASSPIQRLYHSAAILLPDGRTLVGGTDQGKTLFNDTRTRHSIHFHFNINSNH